MPREACRTCAKKKNTWLTYRNRKDSDKRELKAKL